MRRAVERLQKEPLRTDEDLSASERGPEGRKMVAGGVRCLLENDGKERGVGHSKQPRTERGDQAEGDVGKG